MEIRAAVAEDFGGITEIYNSIVLTSTAVYNDAASTVEERIAWWRARTERGFPVIVAADQERVLGYGSFGEFRPFHGYRFTVEGTIHIREGVRGQGLGRQLLNELLDRARALGMHTIIAGVDSENEASLRFLETAGFVRAAEIREVGYKFGRYLNLVFLQYWLHTPAEPPKPAR